MKNFFLVLIVAGLFALTVKAAENNIPVAIAVSPGKYDFNYYHIEYILTADNFILDKEDTIRDNGFFQILIDKKEFPIPAPHCRKRIILRMPSSSTYLATPAEKVLSERSIQLKTALFNKVKEVAAGKLKELKVVIELNPYVKVVTENPLKLELDYCNVFFRTQWNFYVDNLEPLQKQV